MTITPAARPAPPLSIPDLRPSTVACVFWPRDADRRQELAREGRPRLLRLPADAPAPECWDPLEDWIREPFEAGDLDARLSHLEVRAERAERAGRRPHLDLDGVLHSGRHRVPLSGTQAALVAELLERLGEVVPLEQLARTHGAAGGVGTVDAAMRTLHRCRSKLGRVDLELHTLRRRGVLLCVAP